MLLNMAVDRKQFALLYKAGSTKGDTCTRR